MRTAAQSRQTSNFKVYSTSTQSDRSVVQRFGRASSGVAVSDLNFAQSRFGRCHVVQRVNIEINFQPSSSIRLCDRSCFCRLEATNPGDQSSGTVFNSFPTPPREFVQRQARKKVSSRHGFMAPASVLRICIMHNLCICLHYCRCRRKAGQKTAKSACMTLNSTRPPPPSPFISEGSHLVR